MTGSVMGLKFFVLLVVLELSWGSRLAAPMMLAPCDPGIVRRTCEKLNEGGILAFDTVSSQDRSIVHAHELAAMLSVSRNSVFNLFEDLEIDNVETNTNVSSHDAFAVRCSDLCLKTLQALPAGQQPDSSDLACYTTSTGTRCTVDVSDEAFDKVHFETATEAGSAQYGERANQSHVGKALSRLNALPFVDIFQMRINILNLFRIYPPTSIYIDVGIEGSASNDSISMSELSSPEELDVSETQERKAMSVLQAAVTPASQACDSAVSGAVKRTGLWTQAFADLDCKCPSGKVVTGPEGCSDVDYVSDKRKFRAAHFNGYDCYCMDEHRAETCQDRAATGFLLRNKPASCSDLQKSCHRTRIAEACPRTCGRCRVSYFADTPLTTRLAEWSVKAQAYTSKAILNMGSRSVPDIVTKWFGNNHDATRTEVLAVLNGVHRLLSNVDYIYPGKSCKQNVYAYVVTSPPLNKNSRGQYIFHLCPLFLKVDEAEKLETLTHEASHHEAMNRDDVQYGRLPCEKLARKNPRKALQNADSFCFFIDDAAKRMQLVM